LNELQRRTGQNIPSTAFILFYKHFRSTKERTVESQDAENT